MEMEHNSVECLSTITLAVAAGCGWWLYVSLVASLPHQALYVQYRIISPGGCGYNRI